MNARLTVCAVAIAAWPSWAAGQEPTPDPLDQLDGALIETRAGSARASVVSLNELHRKILAMEDRLRQLEEKIATTTLAVSEIEDENKNLREALRVRYGRGRGGLPPVPMPHKELIESVLGRSAEETTQIGVEAPDDTGADTYTIVRQWGRSPETAADLPGNVSSLIGIAAVVAPRRPVSEIEGLGRDLHQTYRHYDNINIQIFDDLAAAKAFADKGTSSTLHLILSISKHRNSVRDTILRFENGFAIEVQ